MTMHGVMDFKVIVVAVTMHGVMDIAIGRCRDYAWGYGYSYRSLP